MMEFENGSDKTELEKGVGRDSDETELLLEHENGSDETGLTMGLLGKRSN